MAEAAEGPAVGPTSVGDSRSPPPSSSPTSVQGQILRFKLFDSAVDEGFWWRLSSLKLDVLGLDQSPIDRLTLLAESLPALSDERSPETSRGNRNRCPVPGILYNTNTMESFHALDKRNLLKMEAEKIFRDLSSGRAEEDCAVLLRFLIISFADLKRWTFHYWFAFPALILNPPATLLSLRPASDVFTPEEADYLSTACNVWRNSSMTAGMPFFLVSISPNAHVTIRPLKDWKACHGDSQKVLVISTSFILSLKRLNYLMFMVMVQLLFGFYDPCHYPSNPGWPLRNFLTFIYLRWKVEKVSFFCYREKHGLADLSLSLVGEALVSVPQDWQEAQFVPQATGWEPNSSGKLMYRTINLKESMDPISLAVAAADLNLKLMKWRALPTLNLAILSNVKCLLLGAGTLGCQVARMLMAWGIRKITLVDNGRVAMSNPLRQSLYELNDCLNGGDMKATAAVNRLKCIFPAVVNSLFSIFLWSVFILPFLDLLIFTELPYRKLQVL
ncbi:hypothetical protein Taro_002617 [Colocasia esculenta]|uniref:Ubiquitin-like modifier-activating enzyme ATG7 n=1 Tax=Colocasia esculenta TaxID=4460 RepID=A0A843TJ49_COLES|nr:hypothetical protein [Colocasia esculenta]